MGAVCCHVTFGVACFTPVSVCGIILIAVCISVCGEDDNVTNSGPS